MNEPGERSPLHSEWATASAADRPVAGTQGTCKGRVSRIRTVSYCIYNYLCTYKMFLFLIGGQESPEEDLVQASVSKRAKLQNELWQVF